MSGESQEYSDLDYATRLDGTTMPPPRVLPGERCWCGGEVGARTPGDHLGLGCLANIAHDWTAASLTSQNLIAAEETTNVVVYWDRLWSKQWLGICDTCDPDGMAVPFGVDGEEAARHWRADHLASHQAFGLDQ